MEKKRGFIKAYLIIALIFGVVGLIDTSLTFLKLDSLIYASIMGMIVILFFLFNLLSLFLLIRYQAEGIYFILPIYHLLLYSALFALSFLVSIVESLANFSWSVFIAIGYLTALFEISFSLYLLKRIKVALPANEHTSRSEPPEEQ